MFPNGVPNPMLAANRQSTIDRITETGADLGLAWDGDYDRCFFFDEQGRFIEGYYVVGLLARSFLDNSPGDRIVHDPRLVWNTLEVVQQAGGYASEYFRITVGIKGKARRGFLTFPERRASGYQLFNNDGGVHVGWFSSRGG